MKNYEVNAFLSAIEELVSLSLKMAEDEQDKRDLNEVLSLVLVKHNTRKLKQEERKQDIKLIRSDNYISPKALIIKSGLISAKELNKRKNDKLLSKCEEYVQKTCIEDFSNIIKAVKAKKPDEPEAYLYRSIYNALKSL